jgi:hypothetical protein
VFFSGWRGGVVFERGERRGERGEKRPPTAADRERGLLSSLSLVLRTKRTGLLAPAGHQARESLHRRRRARALSFVFGGRAEREGKKKEKKGVAFAKASCEGR